MRGTTLPCINEQVGGPSGLIVVYCRGFELVVPDSKANGALIPFWETNAATSGLKDLEKLLSTTDIYAEG